MGLVWTLIIGLVAGVIAKFLHPGDREPGGFILTAFLGVAGAFLFTFIGRGLGWYGPNDGAGLIGATVGAILILVIWGAMTRRA